MSNLVIGWPIYSDAGRLYTPTVSGGSWQTALPLVNVLDRRLHRFARSGAASNPANTQMEVDLKAAQPIFVLAIPAHTISVSGSIRVRASSTVNDFTSAAYDTGTVSAWASALTADDIHGINAGWYHVCTAVVSARYWLIEITDTTNPENTIDVGRIAICGGWQPTINMQYGAELGLEDDSTREVTDGGAAVYNARRARRTFTCTVADLPENEALLNGFDLQRRAGTTKQLVVIYDPDDTTHMHRRAFLATLRQLSALRAAPLARYGVPLAFVEEL